MKNPFIIIIFLKSYFLNVSINWFAPLEEEKEVEENLTHWMNRNDKIKTFPILLYREIYFETFKIELRKIEYWLDDVNGGGKQF